MKKPWIIILAGIILTALIGLWVYLFFGGDEAKENLYNTFGLTGDELPFDLENLFDGDSSSTTSPYLRQLSLRQAGGYVALEASSSTKRTVRFMESGTGHIYSVQIDDGAEERLSNITVASARTAVFSNDGNYAAVTTDGAGEIVLITLPNGSTTLDSRTIQAPIITASFTSTNKLLYTTREGSSVRGYSYNPDTNETKTIFTVPFKEAVVIFNDNESGPHYTYPKTAEELEGYLYKIENGALGRLPISGFGLSVQTGQNILMYTKTENSSPKSYAQQDGYTSETSKAFIPEKCAPHGEIFVCGIDNENRPLTEWYQGEYTSNDSLWYFIPEIDYATQIEDLGATSQRLIDITQPSITDTALYFVNRVDNGLWVYDRDFASEVIDN